MTAQSSRIILAGKVECRTSHGSLLVAVRSGLLQRNIICVPVDGVEPGDEVEVVVGADLEFGNIIPPRGYK